MGHVISINNPNAESYNDASTRADLYFAEAVRFIVAAGEAVRQIEDGEERIKAQTRFLKVANAAMEELVKS